MGWHAWRVEGNTVRIREGGGCLSVFGLPFFAAGIFVCLAVVGAIPMQNDGELPSWGRPVMFLMGLAFAGVGGALVFGRSWTIVSGMPRSVSKAWGLLVPIRAVTHRLDDVTAIVVTFQEGDSDTADKYPIRARRHSGGDVLLTTALSYGDALAIATESARLLQVNVEDASTDHQISLSASEALLPLRHRARLSRSSAERVERPAEMHSEVIEEGNALRIVIPNRPMPPLVLAVLMVPVVLTLIMTAPLAAFFRQTNTPAVVAWVFLTFVVVCFGVLPVLFALSNYVRARRGATIVTVSPDGILVQARSAWRVTTIATLAAAEIFDIDYGIGTEPTLNALSRFVKGRGITVKSRQGLTTFGEGLGDEEMQYLYSRVREKLTGR